jgi:hypothetical protein
MTVFVCVYRRRHQFLVSDSYGFNFRTILYIYLDGHWLKQLNLFSWYLIWTPYKYEHNDMNRQRFVRSQHKFKEFLKISAIAYLLVYDYREKKQETGG